MSLHLRPGDFVLHPAKPDRALWKHVLDVFLVAHPDTYVEYDYEEDMACQRFPATQGWDPRDGEVFTVGPEHPEFIRRTIHLHEFLAAFPVPSTEPEPEVPALRARIDMLSTELERRESRLEGLRAGCRKLRTENVELSTELNALRTERDDLEDQVSELGHENRILIENHDTEIDELCEELRLQTTSSCRSELEELFALRPNEP